MAIQRFLGVMEAEMDGISPMPENVAWMGCHYSKESGKICGLPPVLLAGSMVVLTDEVAFLEADHGTLCGQLWGAVGALSCRYVLLDFQKPVCEEAVCFAEKLAASLPCPVILPAALGGRLDGPVFLPPVPLDVSLPNYLAPWAGREVWLELALDGLEIRLTNSGARSSYLPHPLPFSASHRDERLHCHYNIETAPDAVCFNLRRAREDVEALVTEAEGLGVTGCVGLWQEFG